MQPLSATAAKSPEDIDAVLGRFQAWSATRKATDKTPPKAASKKSDDLPDGVRELSYREALESSRHRWETRTQPPVSNESREAIQTGAEEKPTPAFSPAVQHDKVQHDKPAPAVFPAPSSFNDEAFLPDMVSLSAAARPPAHAMNPQEQPVIPAFGTVFAEAIPTEPDPAALALVWPVAPKNERQVSMSLRVAASEQALIKARAAEAGLSVSAYLRQCALEVEKLRAQVHHTLALIEQRSEQGPVRSLTAGPPPAPILQGGFLARLGQFLFGSPARLTLRA
jgi:hypothetical protein